MRTLIVSATALEVRPFLEKIGCGLPEVGKSVKITSHSSLLISGVGQAVTAYNLGKTLAKSQYDRVINVGICGSFDLAIPMRSTVLVTSERFADLGAERDGKNIDLFEMGLLDPNKFPFQKGILHADKAPSWPILDKVRRVTSVTVNRVLGFSESIKDIQSRYTTEVVNMEGAAVFYVCRAEAVEFFSLRTISDYVDPNKEHTWDIAGAIESLNETIRGLQKYLE